jgi:very-short-patch-repair endonuclease
MMGQMTIPGEWYIDWSRGGIQVKASENPKPRRFPFIFRQQPETIAPRGLSESVIEQSFWDAHKRTRYKGLVGLVQQYKVGYYRIDFAIPRYHIGIELDGFRNHSSTVDIAGDRARERALMKSGWRIIRFGGLEVYKDPDGCVRDAAVIAQMWRGRK